MDVTNKRVAVLLAAYNGHKWLPEQLRTILVQTDIEVSIFISIDPSTDGTEDLCQQIAQQNSTVTLLPTIGKFGSAAPNFFRLIHDVEFSNYDYIAFSDQDDIWNTGKLSKAVEQLKQHQSDAYSSNVTAFWPDGKQKLIDKAQPQVEWDFLFESAGPGCTFVLTRKLALDLQTFIHANREIMSSIYLHDWFSYAFARSRGYKWHIDKLPSMLYRQHSNNQVGINTGYKAFLYRIRFVLSGQAMRQSALLAEFCGLESHPFVKKWYGHSRLGLLYLMTQANKCRRKKSEKFIFSLSCLILAIVGKNSDDQTHKS